MILSLSSSGCAASARGSRYMQNILRTLSVVLGLTIAVGLVMAVFVRRIDKVTGETFDGLGRILTPPTGLASIFASGTSQWAGYGWFVVDMVCFWGGIAIVFYLRSKADDLDRGNHDSH